MGVIRKRAFLLRGQNVFHIKIKLVDMLSGGRVCICVCVWLCFRLIAREKQFYNTGMEIA